MRHRALDSALLISMACACTGGETSELSSPDPSSPDPSSLEQPKDSQTKPQADAQDTAADYFLAVVGQTGVCIEGSEDRWTALRPTLGWTPTDELEGDPLAALLDRPVLARGSADALVPQELPPADGPERICQNMQMRSDWVAGPRGFLVDHGTRLDLEHFSVASVRPLDELSIRREGQELVVEFENPLPFALEDLGMRVHYEGCYGKPGSTSLDTEVLARLEPGARVERRFPVLAEQDHPGPRKAGPSARQHLASALVIAVGGAETPAGAQLHVDLDLPLRSVDGLALACPER
ncbi:hypothetical protein G6O69_24970 [Pseudenhygromyxa sp. WMMC2535]|uniref:hypothetical protein n=1 Tax=Pseudenhygromyxa sp. WMMC2535 TaxID=2712867 RepID=UPI001551B3E7|nr:hypothetical protein [Pseudenhygromyxa sp. WMMC2535]NVB41116.1 hypothetical protein [Pseudenhygromyxa sp. WMMC2535]